MKKIFLLCIASIGCFFTINAQAPKSFNYQAILTNQTGSPIRNQAVGFKVAIVREDQNGQRFSAYSEEYNGIFTSDLGQLNIVIGQGSNQNGSIANINWADGKYFLRTELNTGNGFNNLGEVPFQSMPYALFAENAKNGINNINFNSNDNSLMINSTRVDLSSLKNDNDADPNNENQTLQVNGNQLSISNGNTVTLPTGSGGDNWGNQSVQTQNTLNGNGTSASPLGINNNSITSNHIQDGTINPIDLNKTGVPINSVLKLVGTVNPTWEYRPALRVTASPELAILGNSVTDDINIGLRTSGVAENHVPKFRNGQWQFLPGLEIFAGPGIQLSTVTPGPDRITIAAVDQSATNELQTLSFNSASKILSLNPSGGSVDLSTLGGGGSNPWTINGSNIFNNNSGNVGIGTTSPSGKLHVKGGALVLEENGEFFNINVRANGQVAFEANGTVNNNSLVIDDGPDQSVNIGTDIPQAGFKLNVVGKALFRDGIFFGSVEGLTDGGANTIASNSNIIPTTNGIRDLGNSSFRWRDVYCARNAFNGSDARMKRDIKPLQYGLADIMRLKSYSYRWSSEDMDDGYRHIGVLAQELKTVFPELIRESNTDEKLMSVNYIGLIPILINAIKEQQAEIEELKKQNKELPLLSPEEIVLLKKILSNSSNQK